MTYLGYVLWEGSSAWDGAPIALIATMRTSNRKTGSMVQTWIMRTDIPPTVAVREGLDASVCGACPLRGIGGKSRACYVTLHQAPLSVWKAFTRGRYPRVSIAQGSDILAGNRVRLGAYGDPAMVPFDVIEGLMVRVTPGHSTGYTHQWRTTDSRFARYLMASCESAGDAIMAGEYGYRAFTVIQPGESPPASHVECAATRERAPRQCADCLMCSGTRQGTRDGAVSVWIQAHGVGAKFAHA